MKKLYFLLFVLAFGAGAQAQTIPNAGFETWRYDGAGGDSSVPVMAPKMWFGADSLIIANGQLFGPFLTPPVPVSAWQAQTFKDSTNIHGGSYSVKLVTKRQDTLGLFPGVVSNAEAHIAIDIAAQTFNLYYTGGTHITYRVNTVSAWTMFVPGAAGDSGLLTVQALGNAGGKADSVLGTGTATIGPSSTFTQVTANMVYTVPDLLVDTVRITFASSKGGTASKANSTLYVDDVTMTGIPFSVAELAAGGRLVSVYPNPVADVLNLDAKGNTAMTCRLVSVTGQIVASKTFSGNSSINVSGLPDGLYFYSITDADGNTTQQGNISVVK